MHLTVSALLTVFEHQAHSHWSFASPANCLHLLLSLVCNVSSSSKKKKKKKKSRIEPDSGQIELDKVPPKASGYKGTQDKKYLTTLSALCTNIAVAGRPGSAGSGRLVFIELSSRVATMPLCGDKQLSSQDLFVLIVPRGISAPQVVSRNKHLPQAFSAKSCRIQGVCFLFVFASCCFFPPTTVSLPADGVQKLSPVASARKNANNPNIARGPLVFFRIAYPFVAVQPRP